jgi:hypothetical protein
VIILPARHKGEEVYIAGRDKSDAVQYRKQLVSMAKRHRVSIRFLVETFGQTLLDMFDADIQIQMSTTDNARKEPILMINSRALREELADDDLLWEKAPDPEDVVDIGECWERFKRDVIRFNNLLKQRQTIETAAAGSVLMWDWFLFWSRRHWNATVREKFAENLEKAEPYYQATYQRVQRQLARHGGLDA